MSLLIRGVAQFSLPGLDFLQLPRNKFFLRTHPRFLIWMLIYVLCEICSGASSTGRKSYKDTIHR